MQAAGEAGIKLALHLEPYEGRSAGSVRLDLNHIHSFLHPDGPNSRAAAALLKTPCACDSRRLCPVIFVYDSYRLHPDDWKTLFGRDGGLRCNKNDVFAIALWLGADGGQQVLSSTTVIEHFRRCSAQFTHPMSRPLVAVLMAHTRWFHRCTLAILLLTSTPDTSPPTVFRMEAVL